MNNATDKVSCTLTVLDKHGTVLESKIIKTSRVGRALSRFHDEHTFSAMRRHPEWNEISIETVKHTE